jgi:Flp pilus assembly protein TadG
VTTHNPRRLELVSPVTRATRRAAARWFLLGVRRQVAAIGPVDETGGGPSVEAAILAVVIAVLIAFLLAVGRVTAAEAAADHAARAAARIASVARDPVEAQPAATEEARRVLGEQDLACASLTVTTGLAASPAAGDASTSAGEVGAEVVRAVVTCEVRWSDLGLPVASSTRAVVAEFASPVDIYRERP